jgi:hypothetical protein
MRLQATDRMDCKGHAGLDGAQRAMDYKEQVGAPLDASRRRKHSLIPCKVCMRSLCGLHLLRVAPEHSRVHYTCDIKSNATLMALGVVPTALLHSPPAVCQLPNKR